MKSQKIDTSEILMLWKSHENEFIQYHVIRDQIKTTITKLNKKSSSEYSKSATERTIMRYLQSLVDEKKLEKKIDPDHKTYYKPVNSTVVLKKILQNQIESEKLNSVKILLSDPLKSTINEEKHGNPSEKHTILTLDDVTPGGEAPVDIVFSVDPENKDKVEATNSQLAGDLFFRDTAYKLVTGCQRAILNATENVYKWDGYSNGPPQIHKMVERLKTSLNFDVILSLHFDGKRLVKEYDWEKDIQKYEKNLRVEYETWPSFVSSASQPGLTRDSWIDLCISKRLKQVKSDLEISTTFNHAVASDKASLINQFAEHVVGLEKTGKRLHEGPYPPTVETVKKYLEKMLDDGTLEIAVTFKVNAKKIADRETEAINKISEETGYDLFPF